MGEPQIVADPYGTVAVSQNGMARTVVPQKPLRLGIVRKGIAVLHLNPVIGAEPDPSPGIDGQRAYIL